MCKKLPGEKKKKPCYNKMTQSYGKEKEEEILQQRSYLSSK